MTTPKAAPREGQLVRVQFQVQRNQYLEQHSKAEAVRTTSVPRTTQSRPLFHYAFKALASQSTAHAHHVGQGVKAGHVRKSVGHVRGEVDGRKVTEAVTAHLKSET